ncbi:alpha/beta fold hydrolase [Gordonia phthalatica]|uniref:Alpha/beta hydrolase n=1 Tax=Gordonia phthalatica TaxID=1136941 RepID=A0A0N9MU22_9ACTN|nr:alpha/beta hydrolase [Gordonia phthalatica]ALG86088.1 alpha/beta hydrolase [Gordonia phthalatica]
MTTAQLAERVVDVWGGAVRMRVKVAGSGPALVYLHPAAGFAWDDFLDRLAQRYTVYAPEFPGTSPADPYAIHHVHDVWQVVLMYEELVRKLELDAPVLVGQSFGGMLAAEIAAGFPGRFDKVVLLDAIGLWLDDHPVANWIAAAPDDLPRLLFADPQGPAAQAMLAPPEDPEEAIAAGAGMVWALGCTGKIVWPIPDKGLVDRLHRIDAPSLIVWGEHDALVPAVYAQEFADRIPDSRVVVVPGAGHIPQVEATAETYHAVSEFLAI